MGVTRQSRHAGIRVLIAVAALTVAARASSDDTGAAIAARDALVGEYRHSVVFTAGKTRRSVATIAQHGAGLSVAWEEDAGNLFGGIGVSLDGVFGAAYTESLDGSFRGSGVVAYRIKGGTLDGVRLPYAEEDGPLAGQLIRETLQGSPALEGRFVIVRSVDAEGEDYHSGYVEIEHRGDTYQMTWYTPERSHEGVGLRIGDVLVAGYAHGFAPGIVAACADKDLLTGIGTFGHVGTIGADRMARSGTESAGPSAEPSARCREAIDMWNPSLAGE